MAKVLELTISSDYIRNWDTWSAIRELVQNAIDAHDLGHTMEITYNKNRSQPTLVIVNKGTTLDKSTLLLGGTSKADAHNQRGKFGEGYKLAWLTLLRSGHKIWLRTKTERWTPRIEFSETYGADLLKIDVAENMNNYENEIKVEVRGLAECDWLAIKERFLFEPFVKLGENDFVELGRDKILTNKKYQGHLFVKGIWVGKLPGKYYFGYDLSDLSLDRDRCLADPWDLKSSINRVLNNAAKQDKLSKKDLYLFLQEDSWEESRAILDYVGYGYSNELAAKVSEYFHDMHGKDESIIAVESMQESIEAKHHGFKAIVVPKTIKRLVEEQDGNFEKKKEQKAFEVSKRFSVDDLNLEETEGFLWATDLLKLIDCNYPMQVVEFFGEKILGTFKGGEICIAKRILTDRTELISTMIHEIAHNNGADGTVEHERSIESLFAQLVVRLSNG